VFVQVSAAGRSASITDLWGVAWQQGQWSPLRVHNFREIEMETASKLFLVCATLTSCRVAAMTDPLLGHQCWHVLVH